MATNVLLLENIHPAAKQAFEQAGYTVEITAGALTEDELVARIKSVSILGIRSATHLTPRVFAEASRLEAVGAFCIGTNQIDLAAATEKGVTVFNAPFQNTRSVVELVISEIIALKRQLFAKNAATHRGEWDKSATGSHEVRGLTLGIVGYGNIGSQLSVLAENLGMQVRFFDVSDRLALGNATRCSTLKELLESSDIVTLHVDGRPENKSVIGESELANMRQGALLLNLSRGAVVDIDALKKHLDSGHLAGAALDVYPKEPKAKGERFESPLQGMPQVIMTPHVGGSTEEAQEDIGRFVSNKLIEFVRTGNTTLSVNMPEVQLIRVPKSHRLMYVHKNVPGALARLDETLSASSINITAQSLGTARETGYALTDSDKVLSPKVLQQLQALTETIRLRVCE